MAALSGPVDHDRLAAGLEALAGLGYEPVEAANLRSRTRLFAGRDDQRLAGFHDLAADPQVRAIFFARGGHGALRLLPHIDWQLLARHPRAYVGYSDLTPLLLQVVTRLGLVAFHGPMVAADLARGLTTEERESLLTALAGRFPVTLGLEPGSCGRACEGRLLGGCLSMLVATLGTPFTPDLDGAILFIEELNEPLYRFDRMLTHLRLSGNLTRLSGMVVGHLTQVGGEGGPAESSPGQRSPGDECREVLRQLAEECAWPLVWGLRAGHVSPNLTLPLGMWARLDPRVGRLVVGFAEKSQAPPVSSRVPA
ncbi:MAG: LD-carboxypeptidase [bacterium]|nr:LD-carboxypeptidase [bacterium]